MKAVLWPFLFLLLLSLPLYFFTSHHWSFNDADEPFYAQIAREVAQGGDWLTPHYGGTPCFHKPPLVFWLIAISYKIFGINEFTARLPIIILAIICIFLTYLLAHELFHDFYISFLSSIILLTTYHFLYLGHLVMLDVPTVFFILLGLYGLLHSEYKKEWATLYGFGLGLAILSKGVLGIVLVICILPYIIWQKKFSYGRNPYLWIGIFSGMILCGLWYSYQFKVHGENFLKVHFWEQVFLRSTKEFYNMRGLGIFFYPVQVFLNFFPWSVILPFSLFENIKGSFKKTGTHPSDGSCGDSLIISWVITFFILITIMRTKLPHYSLPFYPILAISAGRFLSYIYKNRFVKSLKIINLIYVVFSIIIFFVIVQVITSPAYSLYHKYVPVFLILSIFFIFLGLLCLISMSRKMFNINKIWTWLLGGGTYAILIFAILTLKIWDFNPEIKQLAKLNISGHIYCVALPNRPDIRYPIRFYFANSAINCIEISQLRQALDKEKDAIILIDENIVRQERLKLYKVIAQEGRWLLIEKEAR